MYEKNLTEDLRLRLSKTDMDFLRRLSADRSVSVSEVIRSIIGEYRRSLDMMDILSKAIKLQEVQEEEERKGVAVHGDTETDIDNKL